MEARKILFSNGTEFMIWQDENCCKCVKAVFYDEKKGKYPNYRCAIQKHIEEACIGDGRGNGRDFEAVSQRICPYRMTERTKRKKKKKKEQTLTIPFEQ